jgi:hypothetical protein
VLLKSDFGTISDDEVEEAFCYSMGLVPPDQAANIAAAHVMLYHHLGRSDRARATLTKYSACGLDQQGEFPGVLQHYFPSVQHTDLVA